MKWMTDESNNESGKLAAQIPVNGRHPSMDGKQVVSLRLCGASFVVVVKKSPWSILKSKVIGVWNSACISTGGLGKLIDDL